MIPPSVLTSAAAILGRTGAGKTFAAKSAVERELAAGARVCVIDPTGAWWGLRARADGTPSIFAPVIFGGDHADVPIDDSSGERLGAIIGKGDVRTSIVDVSDFTSGQTTRFLTDLFEELYRTNRTPLLLVMDEADVMAPQQPLPEQQRLKGAVNKIVRRGRIKGLRPLMITQRPAVIDKSVLSQISTLVAMRLTSPQDRKAVDDWVKSNADADAARTVMESLPRLAVGEGWIWSPAEDVLERVTFPPITTFDSSRTPEEGDAAARPSVLANIDVVALRAALAPAASIPVSLRNGAGSQVDAQVLEAAEERGYERGFSEGVETGRQQAAALMRSATDALESTLKHIEAGGVTRPFAPHEKPEVMARTLAPARSSLAKIRPTSAVDDLSGPQRQLLSALAFWAALGADAPSRAQVAPIAGWKVTSGHLKNVAGSLRNRGLIDYPAEGALALTESGRRAAPMPDIATGVIDRVRSIMTGPQREAFDVLLRADEPVSDGLSRELLAHRAGWNPTSGHVKNVLGSLRTLDVVTYPRAGFVSLSPWIADALASGRGSS